MPDPAVTKVPIGYGADFLRSTTLNGAYTTIGALKDIDPSEITAAKVKQTGINDAGATFREQYRIGMLDFAESTCHIFMTAAVVTQMMNDLLNRTQLFYKFIFSDKVNGVFATTASVLNFSGFVTSVKAETPLEDDVTVAVKFMPDGSTWTFTSGT